MEGVTEISFTISDFENLLHLIETNTDWRRRLRQALFPDIDVEGTLEELVTLTRHLEQTLAEFQHETGQRFEQINQRFDKVENELAEFKRETRQRFEQIDQRFDKVENELAEFQHETGQRFDKIENELAEFKRETRQRFEQIDQRFDKVENELAEFKRETGQRFADVDRRFEEATTERQAMRRDIGELKGKVLEGEYRDKAPAIFGRILRRGRDITADVVDTLQTAYEADQISEAEYDQVLAADLLWQGQTHRTQREILVVLEASWQVDRHDVERAIERATILRRLGLSAVPIVAGREWPADLLAFIEAKPVAYIANGSVNVNSWRATLQAIKLSD